MEYRINWRTGDQISVLGFGTLYIANATEKHAVETISKSPCGWRTWILKQRRR